ncbi:MAG TPA: radical SAM protein [Candidatus Baltobacteraceae bacterium]|nr:radical SAM protein [Candidatus Baltobacteraceae bacterium]
MSRLNVLTSKAAKPHPSGLVSQMAYDALAGVRVVFINMPLRETAKPNTPPEGPGLLAARLRQYGADPTIVDLNAYRITDEAAADLPNGRHMTLDEATALLMAHFDKHGEPDIIALSGMITTLRWQENIARICRWLVPDAFIVSGGGLATEVRTGLFGWIPELDAVAHSEGDDVMLLCARDVKLMKELGTAKALVSSRLSPYHLGHAPDGRPIFFYEGDRANDLDILPFAAWDLLEQDVLGNPVLEWYIQTPVWGTAANNSSATPFTMERSLTAVSSRGCPYACAFCFRGAQGERNYGVRSAAKLVEEVRERVDKYKIDFMGHPDDNFAVQKKRIEELVGAYAELGVRWGTHTRLDEAADERAELMARAGCVYIGFGAESASKPVLERMNKGGHILKYGLTPMKVGDGAYEFPTTMVKGIVNCRNYGIHSNCTWIMGYPGERLEDLKTSAAFILWQRELYTEGLTPGSDAYRTALASVNSRMFTATAYPGTAMFKDPAAKDLLAKTFGLAFDADGEPVCDEALRRYVLELDDATKVMHNAQGEPLFFGAMNMDDFLEARRHADEGCIEKILDM